MTDPCLYGKQIEETLSAVTEIKEHLIGTYDKPGLVGRLVYLEKSHAGFKRLLWIVGSTALSSIVIAAVTWLLKLHS